MLPAPVIQTLELIIVYNLLKSNTILENEVGDLEKDHLLSFILWLYFSSFMFSFLFTVFHSFQHQRTTNIKISEES